MLKPVRDLVYIRPIFDSDKTASGLIHIPDIAKDRCDQGIVIYCGPEVEYVKPGDWVLFPNYSGRLMHIEGKKFIIMNESGVTAVLDMLHEGMKIPGLYIKTLDTTCSDLGMTEYNYEEVTYETAWSIIGDAMSENPHFKKHRESKRVTDGRT